MKSLALVLLLAASSCFLFSAEAPLLSNVHAVYILPMASGLDQFLANRITTAGIFPVVTDPAKADAVFTDKLGELFQSRLDELYPPSPKPAAKDAKPGETQTESTKPADDKPRFLGIGRGKGTIFLVDAKTRTIIWSIYEKSKNSSGDEMNRIAGKVTDRLKKDLGVK